MSNNRVRKLCQKYVKCIVDYFEKFGLIINDDIIFRVIYTLRNDYKHPGLDGIEAKHLTDFKNIIFSLPIAKNVIPDVCEVAIIRHVVKILFFKGEGEA